MDSIRIFGYKSFKKLSVQLHPINLLIGANGAGKSNFLSLFEMLGNIYEKRLGAYVAQVGGVDKLLYQGRKVTDRIAVNLLIAKSEYDLALLESDGKLIVEREVVRCYDDVCPLDLVRKNVITEFQSESSLKDHKEEDLSNYISQIRKFHFHDTGRRSSTFLLRQSTKVSTRDAKSFPDCKVFFKFKRVFSAFSRLRL